MCLTSVAGSTVIAPCSGTLPDVDAFLEKYRGMPGVSWMVPKVLDNQHIIGPDLGMPDWIAIFLIQLPPGRGQVPEAETLNPTLYPKPFPYPTGAGPRAGGAGQGFRD